MGARLPKLAPLRQRRMPPSVRPGHRDVLCAGSGRAILCVLEHSGPFIRSVFSEDAVAHPMTYWPASYAPPPS
ncbi:hypothetical protein D7X74_04210 [Corallococcus sp. CA047B]|nr:hypothetical protein D7X74_04210 [Corallococcus sp. CA047B]